MENLYTKDSIRTVSGQYVNVFEPDPDTILISDIAHSLANQCRFGAHLPVFYSVAEHSLWCATRILNEEQRLAALLHDASEAYLMDFPKPIKRRVEKYLEIEDKLMAVIAKKFGFQYPLCQSVKDIDYVALHHEWENIMLGGIKNFTPYPIDMAKQRFLDEYERLTQTPE